MGNFAVIDTETTWSDRVMSIGVVVAREGSFGFVDSRYYILTPEYQAGGMYSDVLDLVAADHTHRAGRRQAMEEICRWLRDLGVEKIFAYNARFDHTHLPELGEFAWFDIMRLAAYRQYNPAIPACADCCTTGRLKRGYGVEPITRMLSGDEGYRETHNALLDAVDELNIMKLLDLPLEDYSLAAI